jgi:hypothetical protein
MKALVVIPAYDRVELFRECLAALHKNDRSLFEVVVSIDKSEHYKELKKVCNEFECAMLTHIDYMSRRMGADLNTVELLNYAFDSHKRDLMFSDHTHIIAMGSDIIVSNNFVHDLLILSSKFDAYAVSPTTGRQSLEWKLENVNSVVHGSATGQNFCIPLHHWKTISPIVNAFSERFYTKPLTAETLHDRSTVVRVMLDAAKYKQNPSSKRMIAHMLAGEIDGCGEVNSAEDGLIVAALCMYGIPMVSYAANRASHPSNIGVNTTQRYYEDHYAGVVVDDLPKADAFQLKLIG